MIFFFCLLACLLLEPDDFASRLGLLQQASERASERESFASGLAGSSSTALEEAQGRERERGWCKAASTEFRCVLSLLE